VDDGPLLVYVDGCISNVGCQLSLAVFAKRQILLRYGSCFQGLRTRKVQEQVLDALLNGSWNLRNA
jgi:hypothetical protein